MAQSAFPHPSGLCLSFSHLCFEDHDQPFPPHPPGLCSSFDQLRLEDHDPSTQTQSDVDSTTTCQSFSPQPSPPRSSLNVLDLSPSDRGPIAPFRRFRGPLNIYPEDNDPAKWTVLEVIKFFFAEMNRVHWPITSPVPILWC
ncbi:hypothetical protein N7471_007335 [Penicillium samsonianum]|uniref:uncharacterized protein n=1 Tax=Penicillium samsonianum TaxID=1882272 RepID=UPI00254904EF|nr:uncharacterized protein N7471_007335 [Penicillium samsonianum]KAJ6132120.1 hypothetical protein N7471_007335 [Penicillium samsonianum]